MKAFREYHDLYLKTDVLLLPDVFENFRGVCMENYELDPCWYYTAPELAWDACLKKTEVQLELLSNINMLLMIERGIRGGVSMIPTRYSKANNKYMKNFDPTQESRFIQYLDANNWLLDGHRCDIVSSSTSSGVTDGRDGTGDEPPPLAREMQKPASH